MKFLIAVLFALSTLSAFSQNEIKLDDVKNHVNDSVKVRGVIKGIRHLESAKGSPTFINLGRPYPDQLLTIVFFEETRSKLGHSYGKRLERNGSCERKDNKLQWQTTNCDYKP